MDVDVLVNRFEAATFYRAGLHLYKRRGGKRREIRLDVVDES